MKNQDREKAYAKSMEVLFACSTENGFKAAVDSDIHSPYNRIWARDSMICSMAALISEDEFLIGQVKKSLKTLLKFQYKYGQIPSNVNIAENKVSYGGSAGRIDPSLWFLIGFSQYIKRTDDIKFLKAHYPQFKKTINLMHLYEFNERNFIYVPKSGDWADEYIQEGYVLYDQLLYYQALKETSYIRKKMGKNTDQVDKKIKTLKKYININFWVLAKNINNENVYNKVVFKKALKKKRHKLNYLLPYFNPSGYGIPFDGMGNSLALNMDILPKEKQQMLKNYIKLNFSKKTDYLMPAFTPPIKPGNYEWEELKSNYSVKFRNKPYEYHNGGLWPLITGFYAAALAKNDTEEAIKYLDGINRANKKRKWGFFEFENGKTLKPGGTRKQAWSAAAGILAYQTIINHKKLFL